ncbi:MAG: hypothetical protein H6534_08200 [Chthonomonadaceae bacterium]|nr:hypothetical protein [Chthonomonadaceae bacterium]
MDGSVRTRLVPLPMRGTGVEKEGNAGIAIYRPFFTAGILCVLTAGCTLGAVALLGIAQAGSYTKSGWTPWVLAHANSQLYGWIGLFVMGFALQQHAPSPEKRRLFGVLAMVALTGALVGIALRFAAEPMAAMRHPLGVPLGLVSARIQAVAVLAFVLNLTWTRERKGEPLHWSSIFIFASVFWLLVVALVEPFVFAASHGSGAVAFVAKWFQPYREAQFLGFVAQMVFGVAMTKFHSCFAMPPAARTQGLVAWGLWNAGLLVRSFGWMAYERGGFVAGSGTAYFLGGVLLAFGAVTAALSLGVFEVPRVRLGGHRFLRGAFGWLLVSGALLCLEPLHLAVLGIPFSHAYTGAVRHAVTVGFLSQMVLGVGTHVAARMRGIDDVRLPSLVAVFWLLNLGNAARVALEIGTDFNAGAFAPMGMTGFVELSALAIWAYQMARLLSPTKVAYVA